MTSSYKTLASYGFRADRMVEAMQSRRLDAVVLTSPENVFYVTGYTVLPSSGNPILYTLRNRLPYIVHVDSHGKVTLICWGFSVEGVNVAADEIIGINTEAEATTSLQKLLTTGGESHNRVAVESAFQYGLAKAISATAPHIEFGDADDVMAEMRLIKTVDEIAQITESTRTIERTVQELFEVLRVGMSRLELIREAKYRLLKNGADGISHATFAFGKDNPEIALDEKLEKNNLITLDLGGIYHGYCSDTRRYVFSGNVPQELAERYERMVKIVDGVGDALVPGTKYSEVSKRALSLFYQLGEKPIGRMSHVGHNIGLETEEQWIDTSENVVKTGMVINIELYTAAAPFGQIGNEETFVVGAGGPRRISQLPRSIVQLAAEA